MCIRDRDDVGDEIFFVVEGSANVMAPDDHTVLNTIEVGTFFGEIALINSKKRLCSVITESLCTMYVLHKDAFDNLLNSYPTIRRKLREEGKRREKVFKHHTIAPLQSDHHPSPAPSPHDSVKNAGSTSKPNSTTNKHRNSRVILMMNDETLPKPKNSPFHKPQLNIVIDDPYDFKSDPNSRVADAEEDDEGMVQKANVEPVKVKNEKWNASENIALPSRSNHNTPVTKPQKILTLKVKEEETEKQKLIENDEGDESDGEYIGENEFFEDPEVIYRPSRRHQVDGVRERRHSRKSYKRESSFSRAVGIKKIRWGLNLQQDFHYVGNQLYFLVHSQSIVIQTMRLLHICLLYTSPSPRDQA
eukprot:TRINITY_DN3806_c0_g1_i15.p1 TRINITY_DN3806_c0_g1~~TRINITY_DN3806_c0_g1_i15.p1  ORF type:complete len:376 (-),score=69.69 TRINITY_DN3806_c0_g1_i15:35-1114(-)